MSSLTPDFPPASPLRSCLMMLPECGERRPQTREGERRGEESSASPSPEPPSAKVPERAAAMRVRTERFPPRSEPHAADFKRKP